MFRQLPFVLYGLAALSAVTAHGQAVTSTFVIHELDSAQTGGNLAPGPGAHRSAE